MIKFVKKIPDTVRTWIIVLLILVMILCMLLKGDFFNIMTLVIGGLLIIFILIESKVKADEEKENKYKKKQMEDKPKVVVHKYPFDDVKGEYLLKWAYYNEYIAGSRYLNIPYQQLKCGSELKLIKDINNSFDKNAIKIMCGDIHLGFIHKNYIQEMFNKYSEDDNFMIEARLNSIDEKNNKLQLEIGFYKKFIKEEANIYKVIKMNLINTNSYQEIFKTLKGEEYLDIKYLENGSIYYNNHKIGDIKPNDFEKVSALAGDFRIVYKLETINNIKNSELLTGRIEAYVINEQNN